MAFSYRLRPGVEPDGPTGLLSPQGGRIVLDEPLLELLRAADGRTFDEVLAAGSRDLPTPLIVRAALACLAEAGLLERRPATTIAGPRARRRSSCDVSAVIVTWNGVRWLEALATSLHAQTRGGIEVVVVDNGSTDDTVAWLRREHPEFRVIELETARSLAAAINIGVATASGDHILILNQDICLDPEAVAELVEVAEADERCAAVATNLRLMRAPGFLNGLGNRVGDSSWGADIAMGHLDLGQFDEWTEVPSACFAAMLIPRRAWERVGPVDEGFHFYYEDVEWCYRARALGYTIRIAPRALALHAFGGSGTEDGSEGLAPLKLRRVVHGRLRFALKLLAAPEATAFVRNYLGEDLRGLRSALARRRGRETLAYLGGWGRTILDLPGLVAARGQLSGRRVSPVGVLATLPRSVPDTRLEGQAPRLTSQDVMRDYAPLMHQGKTRPMPELTATRRPVLVIVSQDVVDHRMAGPGLRYLEMARALAPDVDPVLAVPNATSLRAEGVQLVRYDEDDPRTLQVLVDNADAAVVSGYMFRKFPFLSTVSTPLVVDLYDPVILENLHYYLDEATEEQSQLNLEAVHVTNHGVRTGDFFLCGSERQRDFWLGVLAANGRVNPRTYLQDQSLRQLVDVVGIGVPDRPPVPGRGLKGRHPRIPEGARTVLWGGGIWNWLDPLTLIRAWPEVLARVPEARLVFLGTRHPNPAVPAHVMAEKAETLARSLGEAGRSIVFIEWVDLEEREALLTEADVGVSLHPMHVETRYSVRARIMDCFWARLPVVLTQGDVASEWVEGYGVGRAVPDGDHQAVAAALVEVLRRPRASWEESFEPLLEGLSWSRLVEPLRRYCLRGAPWAPDRSPHGEPTPERPGPPPPGILVRALDIWRREGALAVASRTISRARRSLLGRP